jgi:hypothetical protein
MSSLVLLYLDQCVFVAQAKGRVPLRDLALLCDFSKIWFGFQIATFMGLGLFAVHELSSRFTHSLIAASIA